MKVSRRTWMWLLIASVAAALHLFLLVYVKPSYFSFLLPPVRTAADRTADGAAAPDAILYVPVELDDSPQEQMVTQLIEEPDTDRTVAPPDETVSPAPGAASGPSSEIGDIAGDASTPLPQGPVRDVVKIPPRPLQITWPDTRRLKHCLGHQVDVRVQVDEEGRILRVESTGSTSPPECVRAALQCAEQIVFAPGRINGRAVKMWTEIRIDFRKRNGS